LATVNAIINEIFPQIYTNLNNMDMLSLAKDIFSYNIVDQTGFPFDNTAKYYKKISYVFPVDLEANVTRLHEFLFETTNYIPTAKVHELSETIKAITDQ